MRPPRDPTMPIPARGPENCLRTRTRAVTFRICPHADAAVSSTPPRDHADSDPWGTGEPLWAPSPHRRSNDLQIRVAARPGKRCGHATSAHRIQPRLASRTDTCRSRAPHPCSAVLLPSASHDARGEAGSLARPRWASVDPETVGRACGDGRASNGSPSSAGSGRAAAARSAAVDDVRSARRSPAPAFLVAALP
jgi:hypothetical protein